LRKRIKSVDFDGLQRRKIANILRGDEIPYKK
jgi:hypothetical protein